MSVEVIRRRNISKKGTGEVSGDSGNQTAMTYYKPTNVESVEMEEVLNAEQDVEPASDMQLCARIAGESRANAPKDRNRVMLDDEEGGRPSEDVLLNRDSPIQISKKYPTLPSSC